MYALKIPIEQNKNLPLSLGVSKYNLIKNEFLSNIKHNNRLEQSLIALQLTKKKSTLISWFLTRMIM